MTKEFDFINPNQNELNKQVENEKYLKDFIIPKNHSKKCKKCLGLGRIGFEYNTKTKTRGEPIPCPNYSREIEQAFRLHIQNKKFEESQNVVEPNSINDLILGK
jgi:hypothetical protein